MVFSIHFDTSFWGTISSCNLLGGIISTSLTDQATCYKRNNTGMYIRNVAGFTTTPNLATSTHNIIKVSFISSTSSTSNNPSIAFGIKLHANYDAYINDYQPIMYDANGLTSVTSSCYWRDTSNCVVLDSNSQKGTFLLQKVTDTFMQVAFKPHSNLGFSTTGYYHNFIITFNSFTYGSSCTVSDLVFEMSSSSTPGTGYNNYFVE